MKKVKKINKKLVVIIFVILVVVLIGLFVFNILNKNYLENYKYLIKYSDRLIPGNSYSIYVFDDYDITVVRQPYCSTTECINSEKTIDQETYEVRLSNKNKNKVEKFIKLLFLNNDSKEISLGIENVDKNSLNVINAITLNNDIYFDEYNIEFDIIDNSSVCASEIEDIYVDGEYVCSFSCVKSDNIIVKIGGKSQYSLIDILNNDVYTIDELNDKGLGCYKK